MGALTTLFAANHQQEPPPQWGQHSGEPPASQPGDNARAELAKRFGTKTDDAGPSGASRVARGAGARAELAKRYGQRGQR